MDKEALALIASLLQYPEADRDVLKQAEQEIETLTNSELTKNILTFLQSCQALATEELAAKYVSTFDFNEQTSLYLTALLFGDERKRITILVALKEIYEKAGFALTERELPDYLPALLEFFCVADEVKAKEAFQLVREGIRLLYQRLSENQSLYKELVAALCIALEEKDLTLPIGGVL